MKWDNISAFLAMGGYAGFVWGAYIVTGLCIALEVVLLTARHRRLRRELHGNQASLT